METPDGKEPRSSVASPRPKRVQGREQMRQVSTDDRESSVSDLAPTETVLLNKEKQELTFLKEKLEWQKKKTEELEEETDFLRGQLSALTVLSVTDLSPSAQQCCQSEKEKVHAPSAVNLKPDTTSFKLLTVQHALISQCAWKGTSLMTLGTWQNCELNLKLRIC
ncbi:hypothetical protein AOLI_G00098020 [Acnodon oligacanthus]